MKLTKLTKQNVLGPKPLFLGQNPCSKYSVNTEYPKMADFLYKTGLKISRFN